MTLGTQLVDGGVVDNAPAGVAIAKGATVIYLLNVGYGGGTLGTVKGIPQILGRTINTFTAQSLFADLEQASSASGVDLHHIHLTDFPDLSFTDFSHVDEMIEAGRKTTERYLLNPQPRQPGSAPAERSLLTPLESARSVPHLRGAQPFTPSYRRAP